MKKNNDENQTTLAIIKKLKRANLSSKNEKILQLTKS